MCTQLHDTLFVGCEIFLSTCVPITVFASAQSGYEQCLWNNHYKPIQEAPQCLPKTSLHATIHQKSYLSAIHDKNIR